MSGTPATAMADDGIAVIGMACRFPDADSPQQYWTNLLAGRESVRDLDLAALRAAGVPESELLDPIYVRTSVPLQGHDTFDAAFFGISPREARVMDPQHRKFIECAWNALEDAGHTPASVNRNIGVYAGAGMHWYLLRNVLGHADLVREMGEFLVRHTGNDKDFLATRVSFHLNLLGPGLNVQTACSTSLVAVHLACQSLLNGEIEMALAGGCTIEVPQGVGYLYRPEEIRSPDGRCRAFDAAAAGTVFGSGCGVVVLRRLRDALDDGDNVYAVFRASAINNDGSDKAGYLAPSVDGQAQCVAEAIAMSGFDPASIGYIEAHGTGTRIGDPIEVAALTQAFGPTGRRQYCALGSVKTNIGHLDTAAGAAGLIKVAMALRHRRLPPTLHYRSPNPEIDFAASPFRVQDSAGDWPALGTPLRAGVSSLGVGGTNAHVLLEEAPAAARRGRVDETGATAQILCVSARTASATAEAARRLADRLEGETDLDLRDVAWTLRTGRVRFDCRLSVAAHDIDAAVARLREPGRVVRAASQAPAVVFMFPGQGAQYPGMAQALYAQDRPFRTVMDGCFDILRGLGRGDVADALYPRTDVAAAAEVLRDTRTAQPALFCVEYALAQALMTRGLRPEAMVGHSIGEYVAACLAGIFELPTALRLVCQRGELVSSLPRGEMIAVSAPRDQVASLLGDGVSLAAVNAPELCVCAGDAGAIAGLRVRLEAAGVAARGLHTSHAFHSAMLDPILPAFRAAVVAACPRLVNDPRIVSNLDGQWLSGERAATPDYWVEHLRRTVEFGACLRRLEDITSRVLLEIGPGRALSTFATAVHPEARTVATLPPASERAGGDDAIEAVAGRLWCHGIAPDWQSWGQPECAHRVPLPGYPFEAQRHWLDPVTAPGVPPAQAIASRLPREAWLSTVDWRCCPLSTDRHQPGRALILSDRGGRGGALARTLRARGWQVLDVAAGAAFARTDAGFELDPGNDADWEQLTLAAGACTHVVYLWSLDTPDGDLEAAQVSCFDRLLRLARRVERVAATDAGATLVVATANAQSIGGAPADPAQALVAGVVRTAPQEYPALRARWVDLDGRAAQPDRIAQILADELDAVAADPDTIAWRGGQRLTTCITPVPAPGARGGALRAGGCYLITGAFGGAGDALARYLARRYRARLILVSRRALPAPPARDGYLANSVPGDPVRRAILQLRRLGRHGARADCISADVADGRALASALAELDVSHIDGVFHAAGTLEDELMALKPIDSARRVLHPKVGGALGLQALLAMDPDFVAYFSSMSAHAGVAGQVDYTAANAFLEAWAAAANARSSRTRHLALSWGPWRDAGMAAASAGRRGVAPVEPADADPVDHPILGSRRRSGVDDWSYYAPLAADVAWFIDQHRLRTGSAVMPATAYLDLVYAAFADLRGGTLPVRMQAVVFHAPLLLAGRERRLLTVDLRAAEGGSRLVSVSSSGADPDDVVLHVEGRIAPLPEGPADTEIAATMPSGLMAVPGPYVHPDLVFGPSWDCLKSLEAAGGSARLHLRLSDEEVLFAHPLHPALLDMAVGAAQHVLAGPELQRDLVPYRYGEVRVRAPLMAELVSNVRARVDGDRLHLDADIDGADGTRLVEVRDLVLRQAPRGRSMQRQEVAATRGEVAAHAERAAFEDAMSHADAMDAMERALAIQGTAQLFVSPRDPAGHLAFLRQAATRGTAIPATEHGSESFQPRPELPDSYVAPVSETERKIATAWEAVLELRGLGSTDNFFELGGHSLLLTRIVARLRREHGLVLSLEQAFERPTIGDWAALAGSGLEAGAPAVVPTVRRVDRSRYLVNERGVDA